MMMDQSALVVNNLTFRYRDRPDPTLQGISLRVKKGELLLVAGASGSGKTTLIRCINGLIPRSYKGELQGSILLYEKDTKELTLSGISQIVGTVLQDPERQILGTLVRNEVAFGLENLGMDRDEIIRRIDQALEYLGISELRSRETFHLSGGEKQKVALAGVLAMHPSILLLDEPLASLDPASAKETLTLVRRLIDEGMTVMMIEHRIEDVLSIRPDRVLFLEEGRERYLGNMEGLYEVVDYHEIKIPAPMIIERAVKEPPPPATKFTSHRHCKPEKTLLLEELPLVRFENVAFNYEAGVDILHGINIDIHRGDVIAILGPNGAGKTTLVKHAIGLLKPKGGRVMVNGQDTRELSIANIASTLGYVFQSPSHMLFAPTVNEELSFGPKNLGHNPQQIEMEVREAIDIVNLKGKENDPPLALSFGQQKRVSIAAILAMRSRILVMDEPTAGQDYRNYMEFMDAILELPNFEAILFITHDVDLAVIYANRIWLMNQGNVVSDGPPQVVLGDPDHLRNNRLVPTSLLQTNLDLFQQTGQFMRAEALAHAIQFN